MLRFQESMVLGMWNDAGFPSLSSLLSSSFGNPGPLLQSSINAPAELERQSSVNSFSAPDDDYTACFGLGSSPFHGLNRGFNTGDGDLMMAAGSVACSTAGVQHKAVAERTNRRRATVSVNKDQITTPLMSKRQRTMCSMKQHHLPQDESSAVARKTPARRNQKLGDKITALQQLVSPFGKTDTASVLYEAALSIKFLHEQIQMLTDPFSVTRTSKEHDQGLAENNADLQSRGLCLVPVYAIIELIEQEGYEMMLRETALNFH